MSLYAFPLPSCLGPAQWRVIQATQIDMLLGSIANGLNSGGGFCAGSRIVVDHQRINGTSFVFSAALPALLAVSASEGIQHTLDPQHAARKHPRNPRDPRARRLHHNTLAPRLAHHPPPRAYAPRHASAPAPAPQCRRHRLRLRSSKAVEPRERCAARRAGVRYPDRGAAAAGYRGRGARAGRVDHARPPAEGPGGCRAASEHPPRCYCGAVAEGVRARGGRRQGGCREGPHEAQVSAGSTTERR